MTKKSVGPILLLLSTVLLAACSPGEPEVPEKSGTALTQPTPAQQLGTASTTQDSGVMNDAIVASAVTDEAVDPGISGSNEQDAVIPEASGVLPVEKPDTQPPAAADKPYEVIDGRISANVIEGWKTYNGGGCGACHGKGATGSVGPNLGESIRTKLSLEDFRNIIANGVSGTMMRPHNTNTRVMDNLDNLYAYLLARGDGVLGPGNLIKSPLGKE